MRPLPIALALIIGLSLGWFLALVVVPDTARNRLEPREGATPPNAERAWRDRLPSTPIRTVRLQPGFETGLYEITAGNTVLYGDAQGRYLVFGHVYELSSNTDLTQQVIDSLEQGGNP